MLKKANSLSTAPLEIMSEKPGDPLVKFSVAKDEFPKLKVKLDKAKKPLSLTNLLPQKRHSLASSDNPIDLFGLLPNQNENLSKEPTDFCLSHTLASSNNEKSVETEVSLEMSNERFGKAKCTCFKIMVGAFYDCIIPEDIESLWGPIPLQKLPRGVDNKCRAVTHG